MKCFEKLFIHVFIGFMKFLGVLCLLSAAVALPTQEQLHTNLPALPPLPELKSEEKDKSRDEQVAIEPNPQIVSKPEIEVSDNAKNPSESAQKPEAEKDQNKDKPVDVISVIQKDSKESKDPEENPKEYKEPRESKEFEEPIEEQKYSNPDESKELHKEQGPVTVHVVKGPLDFLPDWITNVVYNLWPFRSSRSKFRSGDQPEDQAIYIIGESDLDFE